MASVTSPKTPIPPPTQGPNLSQEEQDALKAAVFQRLHPRVYLERFIAEDVRPDGRAFDTFRHVSLNVGEHFLREKKNRKSWIRLNVWKAQAPSPPRTALR
jgi:hypothetical protein